jgi:hypothetical protein
MQSVPACQRRAQCTGVRVAHTIISKSNLQTRNSSLYDRAHVVLVGKIDNDIAANIDLYSLDIGSNLWRCRSYRSVPTPSTNHATTTATAAALYSAATYDDSEV